MNIESYRQVRNPGVHDKVITATDADVADATRRYRSGEIEATELSRIIGNRKRAAMASVLPVFAERLISESVAEDVQSYHFDALARGDEDAMRAAEGVIFDPES